MGNEDWGIESIVTRVHLDNMDIIVAGKAFVGEKVYYAVLKREREGLPIPSTAKGLIKKLIEKEIGSELERVFGTQPNLIKRIFGIKPYEIILEYAGKADY